MSSGAFGIALFVVALVLVIIIHEAGHYTFAKLFGMKVEEFFLGFGPRVWSTRKGETEYGVKAVPLGGYVRIAGMNPFEETAPADLPRTYGAKPAYQRFLVVLAGPITHFAHRVPDPGHLLRRVGDAEVPADGGGRRSIAQDGRRRDRGLPRIRRRPQGGRRHRPRGDGEPTGPGRAHRVPREPRRPADPGDGDPARAHRHGHAHAGAERRPGRRSPGAGGYRTGSGLGRSTPPRQPGGGGGQERLDDGRSDRPAGPEPGQGVRTGRDRRIFHQLGGSPRQVTDPRGLVGGARLAGEAAQAGSWDTLFLLFAEFNIFIGLINLLPLPPLDGGHLAVVAVEKVTRRKIDPRKLVPVAAVVAGFFVLLTVSLLYLDIVNPVPNPFR